MTHQMLAPVYTDTRDRILLGDTPTLMQPRFGELPPPELNKHRYIVGHDGLYIEVRTEVLECRLQVSQSDIPLPYGHVKSGFRLVHGAIPTSLYDRVKQRVEEARPNEWAGLIVWSRSRQKYELFEPPVLDSSPSHISYERHLDDDLLLVVDIHSHPQEAYFSATDDISEAGIYIAEVYGRQRGELMMVSRFVINGVLIDNI